MGGGALGTIGGLVAGAWGARELERRHEKSVYPFAVHSFLYSFLFVSLFLLGGWGEGRWLGVDMADVDHFRHKRERSATGGGSRPGSSSGKKGGIEGMIEGAKSKVEGFLNPESARGEGRDRDRDRDRDRGEGRRHRHRDDDRRGTRSLSRGRYESDSEEEYYERRRR